jgi:hypothetical protein
LLLLVAAMPLAVQKNERGLRGNEAGINVPRCRTQHD